MEAYLKAAQNMPIPAIVITVPGKSNLFSVSSFHFAFFVVSFGTVKTATTVTTRYTILNNHKLALQLKICVANPLKIVPATYPSGLPAEKQPKALFLRGLGFS